MKRRDARELAFMLLFEHSFIGDPLPERFALAEKQREVELDDFVKALCAAAVDHLADIDAKISRHATRWSIGRLPRVTLTLLRLCIAEMDHMEDVPVSVSINEAVELCKRYATEEDAAFLNGVLGAYSKGTLAKIDLAMEPQPRVEPGDEVDMEGDL